MRRLVLPQRRSVHLRDGDYAGLGAYFVTGCTEGRTCRFGFVRDGRMWVNATVSLVSERNPIAWGTS